MSAPAAGLDAQQRAVDTLTPKSTPRSTPRSTLPASPGSTSRSTSPTVADLWRAARGPLAAAAALLIVATLVALVNSRRTAGALDPTATDPSGARALAQLLRDRGVVVDRIETVEGGTANAGADVTIFVPLPDRLPPAAYGSLATSPGDLVVVNPDIGVLSVLAPAARPYGSAPEGARQPACALPVAVTAGVADVGGSTYQPKPGVTGAVGCYAAGGAGSLLAMPRSTGGTVTVLGSPTALTNARLDRLGNAALALGLLGAKARVLWLVPPAGAAVAAGSHDRTVTELLPAWVRPALLQLLIGVGLIALWRARRLGPVVAESLPVVVRAAEAVEGRARLYRVAGARDRAAEALRSGARSRLIDSLGLPPDASPAAVTEAVTGRVRRPSAAVDDLLYGPPPHDDAALVRLADALDALDEEVRRQ